MGGSPCVTLKLVLCWGGTQSSRDEISPVTSNPPVLKLSHRLHLANECIQSVCKFTWRYQHPCFQYEWIIGNERIHPTWWVYEVTHHDGMRLGRTWRTSLKAKRPVLIKIYSIRVCRIRKSQRWLDWTGLVWNGPREKSQCTRSPVLCIARTGGNETGNWVGPEPTATRDEQKNRSFCRE